MDNPEKNNLIYNLRTNRKNTSKFTESFLNKPRTNFTYTDPNIRDKIEEENKIGDGREIPEAERRSPDQEMAEEESQVTNNEELLPLIELDNENVTQAEERIIDFQDRPTPQNISNNDAIFQLTQIITQFTQEIKNNQAQLENKLIDNQTQLENKLINNQTQLENKLIENHTQLIKNQNLLENKIITQLTDTQTSLQTTVQMFENKFLELDKKLAENREEFANQNEIIQQSFLTRIERVEVDVSEKIHEIQRELICENEEMLNKFERSFLTQINDTKEDIITITQNNIRSNNEAQKKLIHEQLQLHINNTLEDKLKELNLHETHDQISNIKTQEHGSIHVTCNGHKSLNENVNDTVGKFNGRLNNPTEFLTKLQKFYDRNRHKHSNYNLTEDEFFIDLIEKCLEGSALRWWEMVRNDITDFDDFSKEFLNKFWNREIQRGIKHKLEYERYRNKGKLSRTDYFIERVLIMKGMTPTPAETDIIDTLTDHFEIHIQDARRVQNIQTIRDFEALLQRTDVEERNSLLKYRNSHENQFDQNHYPQHGKQKGQNSKFEYKNSQINHRPTYFKSNNDNRNHPYYQNPNHNFNKNQDHNQKFYRSKPNFKKTPGPVENKFYTKPQSPRFNNTSPNYHNNPGNGGHHNNYPTRQYYNPKYDQYPTREQYNVCHLMQNLSPINPNNDYNQSQTFEPNHLSKINSVMETENSSALMTQQ